MFTATPVPQNSDHSNLIRYLFSEFKRLENEFANLKVTSIQFEPVYSDPAKPVEGMVVLFKPAGAQTKDGLYTYNNGAWVQAWYDGTWDGG